MTTYDRWLFAREFVRLSTSEDRLIVEVENLGIPVFCISCHMTIALTGYVGLLLGTIFHVIQFG